MSTEEKKPAESGEQTPAGAQPSYRESGTTGREPRARRRVRRILLLLAGPVIVLAVGGWVYMNSGRIAETDNAYVKADTIVLSAEIAGRIDAVLVAENETVSAGQVLAEIDDSTYRVARSRAESQLEAVKSFVTGLQASYQQVLDELALARTEVAFAEREVVREESLAERSLGSERDLDVARTDLERARLQIPILEQRLAQLRAQLGGDSVEGLESHPAYRAVRSMVDTAKIDLEHTTIAAPIDGVASHVPLPGAYVAQGSPVMSVVSTGTVWVEANFKETQLTHVRVGQPVTVRIDTYPGVEWHGRVESISQATGAEFSVIPAQNASGNWVKVAQRIPVRIALDEPVATKTPLRSGMSAIVEVDTGFRREPPPFLGFLSALQTED